MLVKEEGKNEYEALDFRNCRFDYSKGMNTLLVKKTTLLQPSRRCPSNIAYEQVEEVLSKVGVEYEYTIEVDGPNPFILSPDGGKYEIFCMQKKKICSRGLLKKNMLL